MWLSQRHAIRWSQISKCDAQSYAFKKHIAWSNWGVLLTSCRSSILSFSSIDLDENTEEFVDANSFCQKTAPKSCLLCIYPANEVRPLYDVVVKTPDLCCQYKELVPLVLTARCRLLPQLPWWHRGFLDFILCILFTSTTWFLIPWDDRDFVSEKK